MTPYEKIQMREHAINKLAKSVFELETAKEMFDQSGDYMNMLRIDAAITMLCDYIESAGQELHEFKIKHLPIVERR